MNTVNSSDTADASSQEDHSDQSAQSAQSANSSSTVESSSPDGSSGPSHANHTDPSDTSELRRKADRGEMEPLVENYIRQGLSAPDIVDRVYNVDRLLTYQGKKLEAPRVYVIKNKMKEKKSSSPSDRPEETDRASRSSHSVRSDRSHHTASPQQREVPVRLEDSFPDFRDLPPRKREGRKEKRDYAKLNSTVDIELWKRFEDERIRRRWTATDMMELILFNAFGHPTLSYAETEATEPEKPKARGRRVKKAAGRA